MSTLESRFSNTGGSIRFGHLVAQTGPDFTGDSIDLAGTLDWTCGPVGPGVPPLRHHGGMRPDIWIPERSPAVERERLAAIATVHLFPPDGPSPTYVGRGDILVLADDAGRAMDHAAHIEGLRVIQAFSAGVDSIVGRVPAGVILCDAAGVHDVAVAEWVMTVILASQRRLPEHLEGQRAGQWRDERLHRLGPGRRDGRHRRGRFDRLGGGGATGALRRESRPHRAPTPAGRPDDGRAPVDPARPPTSWSASCRSPPETRGIVDATFLAAMRPGALFVNASRGGIVDTEALTEEVLAGRLRAALDVTDPEPLPDGHPLWSAPGVIVTPACRERRACPGEALLASRPRTGRSLRPGRAAHQRRHGRVLSRRLSRSSSSSGPDS